MRKALFLCFLTLIVIDIRAQVIITTTEHETFKSEIKKIKNDNLIVLKQEESTQTSIPIKEIESIHMVSGDYNQDGFIIVGGKKIECDIIGNDLEKIYYVNAEFKIISIYFDSISDFSGISKKNDNEVDEFSHIAKAGYYIKASVGLNIAAAAIMTGSIKITDNNLKFGAIFIGAICEIISIYQLVQCGNELQKSEIEHRKRAMLTQKP